MKTDLKLSEDYNHEVYQEQAKLVIVKGTEFIGYGDSCL